MTRKSMMGLVRKGRRWGSQQGFVVTWDVDSKDRPAVDRVRRFVFGQRVQAHGRIYEYPGFILRRGVRYLAQSALFVCPDLRGELCGFLQALGVDHEVLPATMG